MKNGTEEEENRSQEWLSAVPTEAIGPPNCVSGTPESISALP